MRTLGWLLLIAALVPAFVSVPAVAQEAPAEKPLIQRYLDATEARKPEFRKQLLAMGADGLRKAIAEYRFEKPAKTGTVKLRTMCPDGFVRPMWVYVPESYDPAKSYPLIVHMHGGVGGTPLDSDQVAPGQYEMESWRNVLPPEWRQEVILLGVSAGVRETNEDAMWWRNGGQKNVLHMIRETRRILNIDDDRIYIEGHSDGGSGSFGFAFRRPDTFAGFMPMNGHPLVPQSAGTAVWLENLKGSSIYAVNGGADRLYPAAQLKPIYDQVKALGVNIHVVAHEKLGHQVSPILKDEVPAILNRCLTEWRRVRGLNTVDWTTDNRETGRRLWLEISELLDLGKHNNAPANMDISQPARRVTLGVTLSQSVDAPTVESVVKGSTAEALGVKDGDVILKLDDTALANIDDLRKALGEKSPGDKIHLTVRRGDQELTLKGEFPKGDPQQPGRPTEARVIADCITPGLVTLRQRNTGRITLHVTPQMLDAEGKLKVVLVSPGDKQLVLREALPVAADTATILDAFEAGLDRKDRTIARIELDVAGALGVKREGKKPPQQEDDF
ncbi:MAG: PDZ domain-containing protein [Planctomycetes bacterium]|nr:PDZ domain-containing protein [Planctomycetota bacterium]